MGQLGRGPQIRSIRYARPHVEEMMYLKVPPLELAVVSGLCLHRICLEIVD